MAQKIRGFWFRLCGFLLATFCVVGAGKTAYASCNDNEKNECEDCCEKLASLEGKYKDYTCEKYRGNCYMKGQGMGNEGAYLLEDDAGKFYYKTTVYCAPGGNWVASS